MKKKTTLLLFIIGILLISSILISISYAYYIFNISQSGSNIVKTDCFEIKYSDDKETELKNAIPLLNKEAKELEPYIFTIKNVCNKDVDYKVNIETLENSTIDLKAVAARLDNNKKNILGELKDNESVINNNAISSKNIYSGILKSGEEKQHQLRIWINSFATIEQSMNKSFYYKVAINSTLHVDRTEAKLISGPLLNKTFKKLSGATLSEDEETIEKEIEENKEMIKFFREMTGENAEEVYKKALADGIITESEIDNTMTIQEYSENVLADNYNFVVQDIDDYNAYNINSVDDQITSIKVLNTRPSDNTNIAIISTDDSPVQAIAWYDNGIIYIYSEGYNLKLNSNMGYAFAGLSALESVDFDYFDSSEVQNMKGTFAMTNVKKEFLTSLDTSNVTNFSLFFANSTVDIDDYSIIDISSAIDASCMFMESQPTNGNFGQLDTFNVQNMAYMFSKIENLTNVNFTDFDTSNVTRMTGMFYNTSNITNLDLRSFDTSNVTSMWIMFHGAENLTNLDISSFDTSKVTDMSYMFAYCNNLYELNVSNFDTSNVRYMNGMFEYCRKIVNLDISMFDVSKVIKIARIFYNMDNVEKIYVSNSWNISNVIEGNEIFYEDFKLVGGTGTTYDANHIDAEYARVDDPANGKPGYFTLKTN